jgi:hypothetical protein
MMKIPAPSVVSTKHGPHDLPVIPGDKTHAGIAEEVAPDCWQSVGFVQSYPFHAPPKSHDPGEITDGHCFNPVKARLSAPGCLGCRILLDGPILLFAGQESILSITSQRSSLDGVGEPMELPIDGVLDLHTFKPHEIKDLVPDYLAACRERGILQVRIIHGKGIGNLRRTVHAILAKHPDVVSFALDYPEYGGWGATIARLKSPPT